MTCLGVLERGEQGDDNEISLREKDLIEILTTVLHSRAALSLKILTANFFSKNFEINFP